MINSQSRFFSRNEIKKVVGWWSPDLSRKLGFFLSWIMGVGSWPLGHFDGSLLSPVVGLGTERSRLKKDEREKYERHMGLERERDRQ